MQFPYHTKEHAFFCNAALSSSAISTRKEGIVREYYQTGRIYVRNGPSRYWHEQRLQIALLATLLCP